MLKKFIFHRTNNFNKGYHKRVDNEDFIQIVVAYDGHSYKSVGALVALSLRTKKNWGMDSGCS